MLESTISFSIGTHSISLLEHETLTEFAASLLTIPLKRAAVKLTHVLRWTQDDAHLSVW